MDKAKGGRIEGGRMGGAGERRVVVGKWRQLYLNDNERLKKENKVKLWLIFIFFILYFYILKMSETNTKIIFAINTCLVTSRREASNTITMCCYKCKTILNSYILYDAIIKNHI